MLVSTAGGRIGPGVLARIADLDFEVGKHSAVGRYAGRRVEISAVVRQDVEIVTARAPFSPPLDLGLAITAREFVPIFGEPEASTGDASLDGQYTFVCDERARLRALVVPEVASVLRDAYVAGAGLRITDDAAIVPLMGSDVDLDWIDHALDRVTEAARLVDAAREHVPAPAALAAHAEVLAAWAKRRGLAFDTAPLDARGDVDGRRVSVRAKRAPKGEHRFDVRVRFASKLDLALKIDREGLTASIARLFGKHDVELGDAAFDRRFDVAMAAPHAQAKRLFDAELRAVLLDADARLGRVHVDDAAIGVAAIDPAGVTPAALVDLAEALADGAARLERAARHDGGEDPYR